MLKLHQIPANATFDITLPPSKSIINRELVLAKLAGQQATIPSSDLLCDDIDMMQHGLNAISGDIINVDGAGTALRFLTAYWASQEGSEVTITGNKRLCERPIAPLVGALHQLGAEIVYLEHEGHAPLRIVGHRLRNGCVQLPGDVSSQFVSALLMIAPHVGGMTIQLVGNLVSRPYIDMTIGLMERRGVHVDWNDNNISVREDTYMPAPINTEGDWSAATFWLALKALLPQASIVLRGLNCDSLQGDKRILTIMEQMGMAAHWDDDGTLTADMNQARCCCCSSYADLCGTPDLAPVLVVLMCLLGRPFRFTGLQSLTVKESDRLAALRTELTKLGYLITIEGNDAISWHFATCPPNERPVIDPHGDHRIAMAFALVAARQPISIMDSDVVSKSYPGFWRQLA